MASFHKWDVKNDFAFVLQFFSLISDGLAGVKKVPILARIKIHYRPFFLKDFNQLFVPCRSEQEVG